MPLELTKKFNLQLLYIADTQDPLVQTIVGYGFGWWVVLVVEGAGLKDIDLSCRRHMSDHHLLVAKLRLGS